MTAGSDGGIGQPVAVFLPFLSWTTTAFVIGCLAVVLALHLKPSADNPCSVVLHVDRLGLISVFDGRCSWTTNGQGCILELVTSSVIVSPAFQLRSIVQKLRPEEELDPRLPQQILKATAA